MKRLVSPVWIFPIVIIAALLAYSAGAQTSIIPARGWPPLPQNMVNLVGKTNALAPQAAESIYTVPIDRWLVVTNIAWHDSTSIFNTTAPVGLEQELSGVFTNKTLTSPNSISLLGDGSAFGANSGTAPGSFVSSGVGFTFVPGSKVNIRANLNGSGVGVDYVIVGYLAN